MERLHLNRQIELLGRSLSADYTTDICVFVFEVGNVRQLSHFVLVSSMSGIPE